jgi:hypothetical protein
VRPADFRYGQKSLIQPRCGQIQQALLETVCEIHIRITSFSAAGWPGAALAVGQGLCLAGPCAATGRTAVS